MTKGKFGAILGLAIATVLLLIYIGNDISWRSFIRDCVAGRPFSACSKHLRGYEFAKKGDVVFYRVRSGLIDSSTSVFIEKGGIVFAVLRLDSDKDDVLRQYGYGTLSEGDWVIVRK
jgi:ligand-binding sensor protein